jgi:hypothetical protein
MKAPRHSLARTLTVLLATVLLCAGQLARADGPNKPHRPTDPVVSNTHADLGFEQPQPRLLTGGATMFSVNFVDASHLLVTFNYHGLIPRAEDGSSQDGDRLVAALLIELPDGKILASTHWHTRDREQYVWPLSHGLFLLRIANKLTILDPVRAFRQGDAFHQQDFLNMDADSQRRIGYISVSPGGDLLVVETVPKPVPQEEEVNGGLGAFSGQPARPHPQLNTNPNAEVHFYRMVLTSQPGEPTRLLAEDSGLVTARSLIRVPATSEGFLDISKESPETWLFDFQSHAGKRLELSPFDTTCSPSPFFVSRTDFVAFGCHGSSDRLEFSGFNLRGEEPWIQMLSGQQIAPFIVSAPEAGRFAFSRILVTGSFYDLDNLLPDEIASQEIMVLQSYDGRILLKLQASPAQRAGQNFDISPDGLSFTVIRNGNLEVYQLPALTAKDQEQLKVAASYMPERNEARIRLIPDRPAQTPAESAKSAQVAADSAKVFTVGANPSTQSGTPEPGPSSNPSDATPTLGDAPANQRTPPSLYGPDHPKPPDE